MTRPNSTRDLLPSERCFIARMQQLGFGRFEFLQIRDGRLVLEPWPTTVHDVKFGSCDRDTAQQPTQEEFELKRQVIELIEYVRSIASGEIRRLEIKHGLPFAMEVERRSSSNGDHRG